MTFGIDQTSLEALPQHERIKVCKQIRQQQIENYVRFESSEKLTPRPRSPNKKNTIVQFGINHLLQTAIEAFENKEVVRLLQQGADPNFITANNTTLLHKCCMVGNIVAAETLIGRRVDVNATDADWWTPLHVACYHDNSDLVMLLLRNGAELTLLDIDGNFAFDHVTSDFDSYDFIIEHQNKYGFNPSKQTNLRRKRCENLRRAVEDHLNNGQDVNMQFPGGITFLHMACANGYRSVARTLVNNNADVNVVDSIGWTPLHVAAKYSQLKVVQLLLKHGVETNKVDQYGRKPVEIAATEEIQKVILDSRRGNRNTTVRDTKTKAESDDELESVETVVSKNISTHMSISKTDKILESQMRLAATETLSVPRHHGIEDEEEAEDEPIYVSSIWKVGDSDEARLPVTTSTDDLTTFADLSDNIIMTTLRKRYANQLIYTYIGDILIAVNPFTELPYYAKSISKQYQECTHLPSLTPHVYAIAEQAFRHLEATQMSQCCMISGESGAGKTESCKFLVQHLLRVSGSTESGLSSKINQVNPLLEAFGNARTVMNDNSSRFAKYLDVSYTSEGNVVGAKLSEYLLEKSRVVHQGKGDRNFHIFYWMLSGITPEEASSCLFDKQYRFRYLQSDGGDIRNQLEAEDKQKFWDVKNCLDFVGFSKEDMSGLLSCLAAILHLGNVQFVPVQDGQCCDVENYDSLHKVCRLLHVEFEDLRLSLIEEKMTARGEELRRPMVVSQAEVSRDALAKSLYSRLFSWLVNGINNTIQPVDPSASNLNIAILDIFGFENLKYNGFEQMCINVANEQLQMFFNEQIFQQERQDCLVEGIPVVDVTFPSNQNVINLFLEKNVGILALLDEESTLMQATDRTLATKLHQGPGQNYPQEYKTPRDKGTTFTVVHYAGSISYDMQGMLEKNRDTLRGALSFAMRSSSSLLVKDFFQAGISKTGSLKPSSRQLSIKREMSFRRQLKTSKSPFEFFKKMKSPKMERPEQRREQFAGMRATRKGPPTMAYQFKNSLNEMMTKLQKCQPHFVRCIKPNETKTALGFIPEYIKAQLLYTGILETVKIRKLGYPLRITFSGFVFRYSCLDVLVNGTRRGMTTPEQSCKDILRHYQLQGYQMGKTKIFLRQSQVEVLDEVAREINTKIIKCQATIRGFTARRQRQRLSVLQDGEETEISALTSDVAQCENKLSDWLNYERRHDKERNDVTARLQREVSKSLEDLDMLLDEIDNQSSKKSDVYEAFDTDDNVYADIGNIGDDAHAVPEGDYSLYQDATSLSIGGLPPRQDSLPLPPPPEPMDSSRQFPPSPREVYGPGGFYETIPANGHKVDKRLPPRVPERSPETTLSTFAPRSSSTSSGIYNEPDFHDGSPHAQWQTSPPSPVVKSKLVHPPGQQRHQENKPFSYGVAFPSSPRHQGQGQCNGAELNGQRTRSSSSSSSHSMDNVYPRWANSDQEESDLPPYPADGQGAYHHMQCVPNVPGFGAYPSHSNYSHSQNNAYGVHAPSTAYGAHSPNIAHGVHSPTNAYGVHPPNFSHGGHSSSRITPVPPPVPPPNSCQAGSSNVSSQIQQLKNNAMGSPKQQHRPKSPGSPKMSSKMHNIKVGPQVPDVKMDPKVPPPPNFPAPPPPISPIQGYNALMQSKTRGRSPSPPLPPPPMEPSGRGQKVVPPPPPPISTIPAKAGKVREKDVTHARPSTTVQPQNGGEAQAKELAAEINNIRLKRINSPQVSVPQVAAPVVDNSPTSPLNIRLRSTPGCVDIYKEGRDDSTREVIEELPPPPSPPPEPEPEPEPTRPVAVVTAQPKEVRQKAANKGKGKERPPLPYNMDIEIPDDIDISNVPGVTPVTKDTPNWKREMLEKKNRDKIEDYVRKIMRQREEAAKWRDVPEWKRKILMKKSAEEQDAALAGNEPEPESKGKKTQVERPNREDCGVPKGNQNITPAALGMDPAELESMPPWKRELLFKREKVPMTFFNEFNPEDEDEAPPS